MRVILRTKEFKRGRINKDMKRRIHNYIFKENKRDYNKTSAFLFIINELKSRDSKIRELKRINKRLLEKYQHMEKYDKSLRIRCKILGLKVE